MDDKQVCAMRHKRHVIALNVQLDENTIAELTSRNLINKTMLENTKVAIHLSYVHPRNTRTKIYTGRVACCPLVGRALYQG